MTSDVILLKISEHDVFGSIRQKNFASILLKILIFRVFGYLNDEPSSKFSAPLAGVDGSEVFQ